MQVKAKAKFIHTSPKKMRLVADLIRGLDVEDALTKLVNSKKLRDKLGLNGRKLVSSKFAWQKMVDDLEDVYANVLESKK